MPQNRAGSRIAATANIPKRHRIWAYKSILTVITSPEPRRLRARRRSSTLTQAQDGHLEILTLGIDHSTPGYYYAGTNALIEQATLERARQEAEEIETEVREAR